MATHHVAVSQSVFVIRVSPKALPSVRCLISTVSNSLTHAKQPKMRKISIEPTRKRKKLQEKPLAKSGAIINMYNEDTCFPTHNNKCDECSMYGVPVVSQQPPKPSLQHLQYRARNDQYYGTNSFQHNIKTELQIYTS